MAAEREYEAVEEATQDAGQHGTNTTFESYVLVVNFVFGAGGAVHSPALRVLTCCCVVLGIPYATAHGSTAAHSPPQRVC